MKVITRTRLVTLVDGVTIKTPLAIGKIATQFIDDKMISDKTDTNCNEAGRIDGDTRVSPEREGIEHGSVSVEQQALLGRQSATAMVGTEVGEERSVSELPRRKRTKNNWTKEENKKVWECYLRSKPQERGYRKRMHEIWKQE